MGMTGKFTFKKGKPETGLASIARPDADTAIKIQGKVVGVISAPSRFGHSGWKIRLVVKSENDPAGWRWIQFKPELSSEEAGRRWVLKYQEELQTKYDITFIEGYEP